MPIRKPRRIGTLAQKFWATPMIERSAPYPWLAESCLEFAQNLTDSGYGWVSDNGTVRMAHRLAVELSGETIPAGLLVLHHCDRRACIRRSHLYIGTHSENNDDCLSRGRWRGPGGRRLGDRGSCKFEGCDAPIAGKGFCRRHYFRLRKHGDPAKVLKSGTSGLALGDVVKCSECGAEAKAKNLCQRHYQALWRYGSPKGRERRAKVGIDHPMAKLTWEKVREIRQEYAMGDVTQSQLGAKHGVSQGNIGRIVREKNWKVAS